jgi:hypothetical protein
MAAQRSNHEYESPIANEELATRMSSSAGRKLEKRLQQMGWTAEERSEPDGELEPDGV